MSRYLSPGSSAVAGAAGVTVVLALIVLAARVVGVLWRLRATNAGPGPSAPRSRASFSAGDAFGSLQVPRVAGRDDPRVAP